MKRILFYFSILIFFTACDFLKNANLRKELNKNPELQKSYDLGKRVAKGLSLTLKEDKKKNAFVLGLQDGLKEVKTDSKTKKSKPKEIKNNSSKQEKSTMDTTQKKDKEFLENNKTQEGVKVTASGLQYKVLTEGSGKQPKATDTVEVHYRGTLIDGTEFDSSYKRNQSISFPLNGVIAGWTEGLQLMKEGSKYKLFIPSELGYGAQGTGNVIYPNATLIFEVELIKVK